MKDYGNSWNWLLQCFFDDGSGLGTSAVKFVGNRIIAAKLNGSVDFLELERYSEGHQVGWGFSSGRRSKIKLRFLRNDLLD